MVTTTAPHRALPFAVVFIASACVMTIELVASRLIAPYVGSNLFTWTSIIAVVLAGLSLGNLIGGWWAGRAGEAHAGRSVAAVLVVSAVLALVSVAVVGPVFAASADTPLSLPLRILIGVTIVFFVPAVVLGAVSPLAASWAIATNTNLGSTVGALYAVGSLGAIVGTLATGFVLVSTMGSVAIVVAVAIVLALTALAVRRDLAIVAGALFVAAAGLVVAWGAAGTTISPVAQASGEIVYARETQYQTVAVAWDPERGVRTVVLDNLVHGFVLPDQPRMLLYPYIAAYASAYEVLRTSIGRELTSLHLGGGAYTLPRFLVDAFPDDPVIVAEIDPGVTEANHVAARLERPPPFELHHADARAVVRDLVREGRTVDAIFADAFTDYSIPFHLATVEFYRELDAILSDDGWALLNVIDDLDRPAMLAAILATIAAVHPHVAVLSPAPRSELMGRDTFVVVSSRRPFDPEAIVGVATRAGLRTTVVPVDEVLAAAPGGGARLLTDDFAPVERLVSHLYRPAGRP